MRIEAAALLAAAALAGCESRVGHVWSAWTWEPDGGVDGGCLDPAAAVDVIDGPAPAGSCAEVKCWLGPDGTAYVTDRACEAPADFTDATQATSGACVKALAAFAADGGTIRCPPAPDGGT